MKGKLVLIVGGARSGKSSFALEMAEKQEGSVCFIATADPGDAEMDLRIKNHRACRPADWNTLELHASRDGLKLPGDTAVAVLDCFTVYLSNLMAGMGLDWDPEDEGLMPEPEVLERMKKVEEEALWNVVSILDSVQILILVSNEVGMGVVPPYRLGRIFRDLAGRLNHKLAGEADEVYGVMAGLPFKLKTGR